jgi:hypothetical protein
MDGTALKTYVNSNDEDDVFVQQCWDEASALVNNLLTTSTGRDIPVAVFNRAVLEVGSELFHRRKAPNGISEYTGYDGAPMRVARDPLVGAYPILRRYLVMF